MQRLNQLVALLWMMLLAGCQQAGEILYVGATQAERTAYGLALKRASVGELQVSYYEGGDPQQETVVLVHGFTADKDNWPRFARHLLDDYHVLIPDLAGHGESSWDAAWNYSMPAQAARLRAFLRQLQVGPVHLAGNSMGGFLSATYAVHYPQSVRSLALLDAAGVRSPEPSPMDERIAQGENPFFFDDPQEFLRFWNFAMQDPPWMPQLVVTHLGREHVARRGRYEKIFGDFAGKDLLDQRLGEIRAPTLIVWGDQDRLLDVSMARVYDAGIPAAKTILMEGVGHLPMIERPAESAAIYRKFLHGLSASSPIAQPGS